jgi:hypothetical protein
MTNQNQKRKQLIEEKEVIEILRKVSKETGLPLKEDFKDLDKKIITELINQAKLSQLTEDNLEFVEFLKMIDYELEPFSKVKMRTDRIIKLIELWGKIRNKIEELE